MTKNEWHNLTEEGQMMALGIALDQVVPYAPAAGQMLRGIDFEGLTRIFGLWRCTLYAAREQGRWHWSAGLGLRVLGVQCCSDIDYATADEALEHGIKALDCALRAVLNGAHDPWDQDHRAWLVADALRSTRESVAADVLRLAQPQ